jgi:hypothetical protein
VPRLGVRIAVAWLPCQIELPQHGIDVVSFSPKHGKLAVKRREFSASEIAAWTGQSLGEVERYTKSADQARLARNAAGADGGSGVTFSKASLMIT